MIGSQYDSVRKLLIVEDEPDLATALELVLEHPLVSIAFASSGLEALNLARTLRPQAMLLDVSLPGLDGFEVFRILRRDPFVGPSCRVIFLTARATPGALAMAKDMGAYACLRKPFANDELRARVLEALGIFDEITPAPLRAAGAAADSRAPSPRHPTT